MHAMAILLVHQAKVLKDLHEGSPEPGLMQELHFSDRFHSTRDKGHGTGPRPGDVHYGGPGATSLAEPC